MVMHVFGAGVGRTGTYSLKMALDQLGLGPTHHMEEVLKNPLVQIPLWTEAAQGKADWRALYNGYNSAVDWPTASFYQELAERFPNSKFVLTLRSPESWYESFSETINKLMAGADQAPPHMRPFMEMARGVLSKAGFAGKNDRQKLIDAFNTHTKGVKAAVPAGRLLVFEVKQGWEPLCAFLKLPIPTVSFPTSNSREDFWDRIKNGGPQ